MNVRSGGLEPATTACPTNHGRVHMADPKIAHLYTLSDPRNPDAIRYVGWTAKTAEQRLRAHLADARKSDGRGWHRLNWIRSLLAVGVKPIIRVVAVCDFEEGPAAEIGLIATLRALGHRLTNTTSGGEGVPNPSPEVRARMGAAHLGKKLRPESIAKRSAAQTGMKRSPDFCAKMSATMRGRQASEETRKKLSLSHMGNDSALGSIRSLEYRKALSARLTGKKQSPETIEKRVSKIRGKKRSPEACAAISRGQLGKKMAPEAIAKAVFTRWGHLPGEKKEE